MMVLTKILLLKINDLKGGVIDAVYCFIHLSVITTIIFIVMIGDGVGDDQDGEDDR